MKIFKKNQLIILVISLMLITAGYLNFTARNNNNNKVTTSETIANLGDAALVSETLDNQVSNETADNIAGAESAVSTSETVSNSVGNDASVNTKTSSDYFAKSRLERDSMYSQMLETYQKIYNDTNSDANDKSEALKEIGNITNIKNEIMIAENLITAKGFEDIVIFVNNYSTSIVVKSSNLTPEQVAQIQDIVSRELKTSIEN
ncbi:MAG: SpoIIIAH-like family protein, partial [Firmicutes bacterium]|nr:SpoIIIAH-like family protein [Bacillota bacterium]